ncbi:MAG: hypothetical protein IT329_00055 [Caldilineaceae bacterium]|nr:hypothetical protein [Caldilineaceae bacterium]
MIALATLTLGILGALLWRDRYMLLSYDWQVRWRPLAAGFGVYLVALLMAGAVWADIMAALGSRLGTRTHIRYYCLTTLTKRLPGTVWYVAGRGYLYSRQGDSLGLVTVASGIELAVSVVAGVLVSLGFLAGSALDAIGRGQWTALIVLLGGGLALLQPRVLRRLAARFGLTIPVELGAAQLLRWVVGYSLIWMAGGGIVYLAIQALLPTETGHLGYILGVWSLVGVLSVTVFFLPSNLGFTEVGLSLLLARILPASFAVFVAVFVRLLLLVFEIVGVGVVLLIGQGRARAPKDVATPASRPQ